MVLEAQQLFDALVGPLKSRKEVAAAADQAVVEAAVGVHKLQIRRAVDAAVDTCEWMLEDRSGP